MPVLFHQNLRVYGGGTPQRDNAYNAAFAQIAQQLNGNAGDGPVWVAGATEIVNNRTAVAGWAGLCNSLGVGQNAVIISGISALGTAEFIGIGVHPGLQILSAGRIFLDVGGQQVGLYHDIQDPNNAQWATTLPVAQTPDYRGIVYVIVQANGIPTLAVGFLHNAYTNADIRALVAGSVPGILRTIATNPAFNAQNGHTFLGGDFNVAPLQRGTARTGIAYVYSQGIALADLAQLPAGARAGGTTMAGNLYDYWYSDIAPANAPALFQGANVPPAAAVSIATLDTGAGQAGPMSDHAAALLRVG